MGAISFWIISISMVAATVFFLMESMAVGAHWKTSLNVGALVTLVAAVQMIEFYLILSAVQRNISAAMFWRLLVGTVVMLAFGYMGEAGFVNSWAGFVVGLAGWFFILFEIFMGEAGEVAATGDKVNGYVKQSFQTMRFIVTIGWSIYPLGYFFGYLMGGVDDDILNLVYNLADFVNKIAFCLAIWSSAKKSTLDGGDALLA